jgi:TonB-dependent starch-binding outer membrane protein SusC
MVQDNVKPINNKSMKKINELDGDFKIPGCKKFIRIMKITGLLLMLSVVSVFAGKSYSQTKLLNFRADNTTVKDVLEKIEDQSEFYFMYSGKVIDANREVSVNITDQKIDVALEQLFAGTDVYYTIRDRIIVLTTPEILSKESLVALQQKTVSGTVTDESGEPLPGVTVIVTGTTQGTVTNVNGEFSLAIPEDAETLQFSFVGMHTQEVPIEGRTTFTVIMEADIVGIEEVVAIGYGVQKKKLITGATLQVKGENIEKLNSVSVLGALQSQTPGVYITQSSGQVGEGFRINIRGLGTTGETSPLYVIDGVAGGSLSSLNPSDIESIDVLKDAASAAIYGARAANGVILVTTKKGKAGKLQITYDGYFGVQNAITNDVTPLNAEQYMEIINKALLTQDISGGLLYNWEDELPASMLASIKNGSWNGTNWLKEGTNANAPITSHAVNLMGGNDQSRFSLGFSYLMQEGTIGYPATPHYDRYTARMNSDHSIWKKNGRDIIRFGENIVFSNYSKSGVSIGNMYSNNVRNLLKMSPLLPAYNDQGDYYIYKDMVEDGWNFEQELNNPLAHLDYTRKNRNSVTRRLQANSFLEIAPLKELKFKSSLGYNFYQNSYRYYVPTYVLSAKTTNITDDVTQSQSWSTNWTWENTLNYTKLFGEHSIDALVGQSMEKWGYGESVYIKNSNSLFPGSYDHAYIGNTQGLDNTNTDISGEPSTAGSLASIFGRINYNFLEKYLLSLVMRADGSSNFARGNRWGYFPSVSAGWVITNEPFMESVPDLMNFLKLRGSWGQNGNCNIDNFQYLATIAFNSSAYFYDDKNNPSTGAYPDILPNPDVTWETSEQLDLGFDARFFDSRLGMNFDWYIKTTKDWLVVAPTLLSYGTGAPFINGGDVENKGVELAFSWVDRIGSDFKYDINMNLAHNKNNVLRLANEEGIIHGPDQVIAENTTESFRVEVGYPMGYFWGYKTLGVFQNQAQIDQFLADGGVTKQSTPVPGDLIFQNTDENDVIDENDKTYIGNPHPDFTGSLSLNLSYKGLDFSMTAYGAFGQQIIKCYRSYSDTPNDNYTTDVYTKYWTGEGSTNRYPAFSFGKHQNFVDISDIYIEDGDYVKISNITIGYNFKNMWKNLPVSQLRIYATAQNMFTISNYSGMDPEIGFGGGVSWASGVDNGYYPSSRTYMVGMNLKF